MRGHPTEEFIVDRTVQAQSLGAWRGTQPSGELDLDSIVMFDVPRPNGTLILKCAPGSGAMPATISMSTIPYGVRIVVRIAQIQSCRISGGGRSPG